MRSIVRIKLLHDSIYEATYFDLWSSIIRITSKCHIDAYDWSKFHISMARCKTALTPVRCKWSYCSLALSHRCPYIYVNNCGLVTPYRRLSHMRVSLAACREPAGSYNRLLQELYVFNIKRNIFHSMIHIPPLWYFDFIWVIYPHRFHRVKFFIIPPCFVWLQYYHDDVI